jgi:predicted ferric reductase
MPSSTAPNPIDHLPAGMSLRALITMQLAVAAGAVAAVAVLPALLPGLSDSFLGSAPKAYWYLSRASALVAFCLLWFAMALGLGITNKLARLWPGGLTAFELHQAASLLGLDLALFHGLILLGDRYMNFSLGQVLVPFATASYRPLWTGLGQIGFYLFAIVSLSFYLRRFIGQKAWRTLHYLSFVVFALALTHGLLSGTDSGAPFVRGLYLASGASLLFLTVYRVLVSASKPAPSRAR